MEHQPTSSAIADRASIVAFLAAEAKRSDNAARGISAEASYSTAVSHMHERLVTRASLCRTLAAQIERGDDRQGQDPPPSQPDHEATIAGLRKELSTIRNHLRRCLYAVNDGFIIPCLLDMSAAWERMAEAMHVAPVDSEKMAARCEELASIVSTIASRGNLVDDDRFGAAADREVER